MKTLLIALALLFVVMTVLPRIRHSYWVIRACDFPRLQIVTAGFFITVVYLITWDRLSLFENVVLSALGLALAYQMTWLWHYMPWASRQAKDAEEEHPDDALTVLSANVWIENRAPSRLLDLIDYHDPDVILTLESDAFWCDALADALDEEYPHALYRPQDDAYGLTLHSRLPLRDAKIECLLEDDVPSVRAFVALPSGREILFRGLHPRPPHPGKPDTAERDAEILVVAHEIEAHFANGGAPVVVAGDFNEVPWSYTKRMFQKIGGLVDPRVGRGTYNTFPVNHPYVRYPLDHIVHSTHFRVHTFRRTMDYGSDHFALVATLQVAPVPDEEARWEPTEAEREQARGEIARAGPDAYRNVQGAMQEPGRSG